MWEMLCEVLECVVDVWKLRDGVECGGVGGAETVPRGAVSTSGRRHYTLDADASPLSSVSNVLPVNWSFSDSKIFVSSATVGCYSDLRYLLVHSIRYLLTSYYYQLRGTGIHYLPMVRIYRYQQIKICTYPSMRLWHVCNLLKLKFVAGRYCFTRLSSVY